MTNAGLNAQWSEDFAPFHPGTRVANLSDVVLDDTVVPIGTQGRVVSVRPTGGYAVRFGDDVVILDHDAICDSDPLYKSA